MLEELNVGKKIKRLRKLKNMNAKDLAQNAGISYGMLSLLENGSTQGSVETLRKIAKVLIKDTACIVLQAVFLYN